MPGRGSSGGAVNSITKQASTEYNFNKVEAGLGTDDYRRITLDSNNKITEDIAVRVNVLHAYEEVPERSPTDKERNGLALSASFNPTEKLNIIADYYTIEAEDLPDLGTYIVSRGKPVKDIPVYAQQQDFLESDVETFTLKFDYDLSDNISLSNSTRYGTTENGYVVTGARGTTRDASDTIAPGASTVGLSTHQGWQDVEYFVNQLNVYIDTEIANMNHQFVISAEYTDHEVINGRYNVNNTAATNCVVAGRSASAGYCLDDGLGNTVGNIDNLLGRQ